jgi:hypothetical protein
MRLVGMGRRLRHRLVDRRRVGRAVGAQRLLVLFILPGNIIEHGDSLAVANQAILRLVSAH